MFGKGKKDDDGLARVDFQISQVDNQKNEYYLKLGKLYFEDAKDKEQNGEYKEIIDKIEEYNNQLQELGDERLRLQGLIRCTSCNGSVPIGSTFCSHCGAKIEDIFGENFSLCVGCGKSFASDMEFCPYCGKKRG